LDTGVHTTNPERLEEQYFAALCDLCVATEEALDGLTAHSLPELQQGIAKQEALAARLRQMIDGSSSLRDSFASLHLAGEADPIAGEILSMHRKLAVLNRRYWALLSRFKRSVDLSLAVCRSCVDGFSGTSSASPARTWSCEI
jgi:hypothetical protein